MFSKLDYLFNIALMACIAYVALVVSVGLARYAWGLL